MSVCPPVRPYETKSAPGKTWRIREAVKPPVINANSRIRNFEDEWYQKKIETQEFLMEETNCQSSSTTLPQQCPTVEPRPQTIEQASQIQALSPVSDSKQETLQMIFEWIVPVHSKCLLVPPTYRQVAVLSKLDSSSFYRVRQGSRLVNKWLSRWRRCFPIRQPVSWLTLNGNDTAYLTSRKTDRIVPFKLRENNMYELLRVEPEYIHVLTSIFGCKTSNLMKQDSSPEASTEWKGLCRYVMSQFGLHLDSDGIVSNSSEVPDYVTTMEFGAKCFPALLVRNCLQKWKHEKTTLAELSVSFREKLEDNLEMVEELLSGFKFEKVWSPSSHGESLFSRAGLWEYEKLLDKKYSLTPDDDPVLIYAALSTDGEKMAVLTVAGHAVKLCFCYLEDEGALLELRDRFMEVTKSDDYDCVSEPKLEALLQRLRPENG